MVKLPERTAMAENKTDFIASETLYLNAAGQVVKEKDPSKLTKLVQAGGRLSREIAIKHGLTDGGVVEPAIKAPARVYLNQLGEVVGEKDKSKMTLLAAAGGNLTEEQAAKLGLLKPATTQTENADPTGPPANRLPIQQPAPKPFVPSSPESVESAGNAGQSGQTGQAGQAKKKKK